MEIIGNLIVPLFSLASILVPVILIIYVVQLVRRTERRAEEKLQLEKDNAALQQQQMTAITELNQRLTRIESLLKEVE